MVKKAVSHSGVTTQKKNKFFFINYSYSGLKVMQRHSSLRHNKVLACEGRGFVCFSG